MCDEFLSIIDNLQPAAKFIDGGLGRNLASRGTAWRIAATIGVTTATLATPKEDTEQDQARA